jgi:hypothetical protein
MMRPGFARTSSAASGLRFCGMMEEPVVNLSESFTKRNWLVDQMTISSASRDRCMEQMAQALSVSRTKSRSATVSSELRVGRSKPKAFAVMWRSMGKLVPASAAAPSGFSFIRLRASARRERSRASIST